MTERTTAVTETETSSDPTKLDDLDPRLAVLVKLIDDGTLTGVGITFIVSGTLYTGTLISGEAWHERVVEATANANEVTREVASALTEPLPESRKRAREVLHLDGVSILSAGESRELAGGVLRLRLSAVDGWVLGIATSE